MITASSGCFARIYRSPGRANRHCWNKSREPDGSARRRHENYNGVYYGTLVAPMSEAVNHRTSFIPPRPGY
jgi:hypothetical protein